MINEVHCTWQKSENVSEKDKKNWRKSVIFWSHKKYNNVGLHQQPTEMWVLCEYSMLLYTGILIMN